MIESAPDGRRRFRQPVLYGDGAIAGWVEWWADEDQVKIGDARAPRVVDLTLESDGYQPVLRMRVEIVAGVPQCRAATIESAGDGREVMLQDLRSVQLANFIELAIGSATLELLETRDDGSVVVGHLHSRAIIAATRTARAPRKITDAVKRQAADVYLANLTGNPTLAVAKHFGVSPRSAGKYLKAAEEANYLKAPSAPGAKRSAPDA